MIGIAINRSALHRRLHAYHHLLLAILLAAPALADEPSVKAGVDEVGRAGEHVQE